MAVRTEMQMYFKEDDGGGSSWHSHDWQAPTSGRHKGKDKDEATGKKEDEEWEEDRRLDQKIREFNVTHLPDGQRRFYSRKG